MPDRDLTKQIIGAAIEVHRAIGPGLLESAYQQCLAHELSLRGIGFVREQEIPVVYKNVNLDCGYRLDFLIEDGVIVEVKAVSELSAIHQAQLLTYLRLLDCRVGLLINFNVPQLTDGIKRLAN